jgi:glycosyltransferase involved in cell wall biosynthesis
MSLPVASVCLDAQGAQSHDHHDRGIARYIVEHTRALHDAHSQALHSIVLNPTLPLAGSLDWLLGDARLSWGTSDRRVARRPRTIPAIYHVMSPFELHQTPDALWPAWARTPRVRAVVTLYDTIPLVFPDHYLRNPVIAARYRTRAELVRSADRVLAISQTTADDAVERLGVARDRVSVIHAGATAKFADMHRTPQAAWSVLSGSLPELRPGFVLYVAGFEFRKNLERVIAGYGLVPERLRADHQLVIACRMTASEREQVRLWARAAGVRERELVLTGYVSDTELGALYRTCALLLFASIYEGSGLPILEGMSCGAPVAASNTSTSPEILGDLRATFDPYDPSAIASCLAETLDSPALLASLAERSRERVRHYSWAAVAEHTLAAYEGTLESAPHARNGRRGRARPRIAMVTPWPPQRSGVADYSYRLARALGRRADVDIVVGEPLERFAPPQEHGVNLATAEGFRAMESIRQPDRVLYCMGNSSFHGHVYELLRERPGAVVAHDVRLTGFYGWFAGLERPEDPAGRLAERIAALYGMRMPRDVRDGQTPNWQRQAALGIYMTGEIQQYAEQLLVHSDHARDVLELDRGVLQRAVPTSVLPFGMPAPANIARSIGDVGEAPHLVSVGVVSEVKDLETLIGAVGILAETRPRARLTIAGPGEQAELERWRARARELAPAATVEVTGHVPAERYERLLGECDLAVQLRTLSNGEASAAIADCLAAGAPTVVTDIGWARELPDGVVARVARESSATVLAAELDALLGDRPARAALSAHARRYASEHSFERVASAYLQALELL